MPSDESGIVLLASSSPKLSSSETSAPDGSTPTIVPDTVPLAELLEGLLEVSSQPVPTYKQANSTRNEKKIRHFIKKAFILM